MIPLQEAAMRLWEHLQERPDGPMAFRFVLQPLMAAVIAVRDGIKDGRTGRPPYLAALLGSGSGRRAALEEGVRATARILILAVVLDVIYQVLVYRAFYPGETIIIAVLLGFVPYSLIRGPTGRIVRLRHARDDGDGSE